MVAFILLRLDMKNCFHVIVYKQPMSNVSPYSLFTKKHYPAENHALLNNIQRKKKLDLWYLE